MTSVAQLPNETERAQRLAQCAAMFARWMADMDALEALDDPDAPGSASTNSDWEMPRERGKQNQTRKTTKATSAKPPSSMVQSPGLRPKSRRSALIRTNTFCDMNAPLGILVFQR